MHLIDFRTVLLFTTLRLQFFISTDLSGNGVKKNISLRSKLYHAIHKVTKSDENKCALFRLLDFRSIYSCEAFRYLLKAGNILILTKFLNADLVGKANPKSNSRKASA